jgi:hypothetical protein
MVNQIFSLSSSLPIRWFRCPALVQSGFFGTGKSSNQMEGPYFITVEKLLFSFLLLDSWLMEEGHHLEKLFWNIGAAFNVTPIFQWLQNKSIMSNSELSLNFGVSHGKFHNQTTFCKKRNMNWLDCRWKRTIN